MIGISKLYCGTVELSDALRYRRTTPDTPSHLLQFAPEKKPVVVWNVTRACNLRCSHCYAYADGGAAADELTTAEGKQLLDRLAAFGVPVVLFSGGEPLLRPDIFELIGYARDLGLRAVLSTNGTLLEEKTVRRLRDLDLSYAGISIDGAAPVHDRFRGVSGAYEKSLAGARRCRDAGIKVGFRFTIQRGNVDEVPAIFDLVEAESVPRVCFYHLVVSGRGAGLRDMMLDHEQSRRTVDTIIDRTAALHRGGRSTEVLTVDNHADGAYLYLRMRREENPRADDVLALLRRNGGNSSGVGIAAVGWDGAVYPDQFWRHYSLGNVRSRPFGEIWTDLSDPFFRRLKEKKRYVDGRCASCRFLDICGGNFRVRAEALTGDVWAADPACYLTDREIGLDG